MDSLCEGLQGDVLLQRFLYDWKGCCEIGKECFQLRKVLVSCLSSPEQETSWLSLWSWCLQTTRLLVQTSAVKMCTKGAFYSADGGHLCLRKAANSGLASSWQSWQMIYFLKYQLLWLDILIMNFHELLLWRSAQLQKFCITNLWGSEGILRSAPCSYGHLVWTGQALSWWD